MLMSHITRRGAPVSFVTRDKGVGDRTTRVPSSRVVRFTVEGQPSFS